jgi:hypothetical protein
MQPGKLPIDLGLADSGLTQDQQARHAPIARMRQNALHLVENDFSSWIRDPTVGPHLAQACLIARVRKKAAPQALVSRAVCHE